jgi:hypothetical protein
MVNQMFRKGTFVYQCEFCGFAYSELETAESCEEFCGTHGTCSSEITGYAVIRPVVRVIPVSA